MADQRNEGEGNKTAARRFNRDQIGFAHSGKVDQAAREAEHALDTAEGRDLREAEREGKRHAHGEDPAVAQSKRSPER
ncbi:MAG TPA: hypothetical protein VGG99_25835 [Acetobacteraceae bacterium]|jgi:hypothetical protein